MLGNPLVRFCEGQGGNLGTVLCHPQPESTLSTRPNEHEHVLVIFRGISRFYQGALAGFL
jgi:hypothetical protein